MWPTRQTHIPSNTTKLDLRIQCIGAPNSTSRAYPIVYCTTGQFVNSLHMSPRWVHTCSPRKPMRESFSHLHNGLESVSWETLRAHVEHTKTTSRPNTTTKWTRICFTGIRISLLGWPALAIGHTLTQQSVPTCILGSDLFSSYTHLYMRPSIHVQPTKTTCCSAITITKRTQAYRTIGIANSTFCGLQPRGRALGTSVYTS